jgi:hypothetical protein
MTEKQYKYTAKIKQPQTVGSVMLTPKGGWFSEREYKEMKKDAYGASLLEKGLLTVEEVPALGETIPDFESGGKGKRK